MEKFEILSEIDLVEYEGGSVLAKLLNNGSLLSNPIERYPKIPEPVPRVLY